MIMIRDVIKDVIERCQPLSAEERTWRTEALREFGWSEEYITARLDGIDQTRKVLRDEFLARFN
jgi:hypothetical protein